MKQENMDTDTSLKEENSQKCKMENDKKSKTEDSASFQYEGICFQELAQNKVRCGVCQVECARLIVHLNGSPDCAKCFTNMANLKTEYSKYRSIEVEREEKSTMPRKNLKTRKVLKRK